MRAHRSSPAPSAGGFTNGAKVNPGGVKAVDKQQGSLSGVTTPLSSAHVHSVKPFHTQGLSLQPHPWPEGPTAHCALPPLRLGSRGPEGFSPGAQNVW